MKMILKKLSIILLLGFLFNENTILGQIVRETNVGNVIIPSKENIILINDDKSCKDNKKPTTENYKNNIIEPNDKSIKKNNDSNETSSDVK